jgi:hypothetical protein
MKLLNFAFIALLISTLFTACSKDDDASPAPPAGSAIQGLFSGKYGFGNDTPDIGYKLNFKSNGVIQEIGISSGDAVGEGKYTLKGNHLSASYTMLFAPYGDYFVEATFDAATNTLTGTWGYKEGGVDGGLLSLKK